MVLEKHELLVIGGHLTQHVQQTNHCQGFVQDLQGIANKVLVTRGKDVGWQI